MSASPADRNLLFGLLAVQLDFVSKDALLAAMSAWVLDKARPLGDILRDQGALDADALRLLDALVSKHVAQHGDDPRRSLATASSVGPLPDGLRALTDPDVRASLAAATVTDDGPAWAVPPPPDAAAP